MKEFAALDAIFRGIWLCWFAMLATVILILLRFGI